MGKKEDIPCPKSKNWSQAERGIRRCRGGGGLAVKEAV